MDNIIKDDRLTKEENKIEASAITGKTYDTLVKQVQAEYAYCKLSQGNRINVGLERLKAYGNQRKNPDLVGDTLMFAVINSVMAELYKNVMTVSFSGSEDGDDDIAGNVDSMAVHDYKLMKKPIIDYKWLFQTCFHGVGIVEMTQFIKRGNLMVPCPNLKDSMTFLRDPKASSINGDTLDGQGRMRFGGEEIEIVRSDLTEAKGYFDIKNLSSSVEISNLVKQAYKARLVAQGLDDSAFDNDSTSFGENSLVPAIRWFTTWKGKLVLGTFNSDLTKCIKYTELKTNGVWPLVHRPLYPSFGTFEGISIPDLVEDKQKQRSVMINLTMLGAKNDSYPTSLYDEDMIKNKKDLENTDWNKFIPVKNEDGKALNNAVVPLQKSSVKMELVNYVLNTLEASAERATATTKTKQGMPTSGDNTLGEMNMVEANASDRYSLTAKVFGWSEEEFWQFYYGLYKQHTVATDKKMIRVLGSYGSKWRPLTKENMIFNSDPDITIDDLQTTEAKSMKERLMLKDLGSVLVNDQTANIRYYEKKMSKLSGFDKEETERLLPPTVEELSAEKENESLSENKLVEVHPNDDDMVHMEYHNKASETNAKKAHIEGHRKNMLVKRDQPELFQSAADTGIPEQAGVGGTKLLQSPNATGKPNQQKQPQQITPSVMADKTAKINA